MRNLTTVVVVLSALALTDQTCAQDEPPARMPGQILNPSSELFQADVASAAGRKAYFGDLHVHTKYSFDAFAFGTIASPRDAYRYALGESIPHPSGYDVRLRAPLDFYAITDHAGYLGGLNLGANPDTEFAQLEFNKPLHNLNAAENLNNQTIGLRGQTFAGYLRASLGALARGEYDSEVLIAASKGAWLDIIEAAQEFNDPGRFTTFVAYEYTATSANAGNLHRNVIFRGADKIPTEPFSSLHSRNPEDLWDWLDNLRAQGVEAMAIPHNSNASNGQMFALADWAGNPIGDDYAEQRLRNEPLVEITQIKGTSETHPLLSTRDEWASFEIMPYLIGRRDKGQVAGSYVREALLNGIRLKESGQKNPFEFGLIASSDTHNGAASVEEDNHFSKLALMDGDAFLRGSVPLSQSQQALVNQSGRQTVVETEQGQYVQSVYETWSAAGLTGVWAEENTRDAIYSALRRKETFATSGPRLQIRLFAAGGDKSKELSGRNPLEAAYRHGVPMGSKLKVQGRQSTLLVWATRDPNSAPLQRLQIIKGWVKDGEAHEQIFDVACAQGEVDMKSHRCSPSTATVDISTCAYDQNAGASELRVIWQDPETDNNDGSVFYYARVLENPTCRWSTWDAVRAGVAPRKGLAATLQERAWSSPIWLDFEN